MVITRIGRPARHRDNTVAGLRTQFGDALLQNQIKERSAVSESAEKNKPIYDMNDYEAAREFTAVCEELLKRIGVKK
jgi:chromosome partitioning protein